MERKIEVTLATLKSHNHIVGDIERGVKVFQSGKVEFEEREPNLYWAKVPHKGGFKLATVSFTRDGQDIESHYCSCCWNSSGKPVCRHVVAAVLTIQGRVVETKLTLGKTATATTTVTVSNTAKAVGSGSLDVFATPMMIALMEQAACECLADAISEEETTVGTSISATHTAASGLGSKITATATIEYIFGRKVEFIVTASDECGVIGKGKHTRAIIDEKRFMAKLSNKKS